MKENWSMRRHSHQAWSNWHRQAASLLGIHAPSSAWAQENRGCRKVRLQFLQHFLLSSKHVTEHDTKERLSCWDFMNVSTGFAPFSNALTCPLKLVYQEHSDSSKRGLIQDCSYPRAIFLIFVNMLQNHPESSLIRQIPAYYSSLSRWHLMFGKC